MRSFATLLLLFVFSFAPLMAQGDGSASQVVAGNGDSVMEDRDLSSFTGIKAYCNLEVLLTPGMTTTVSIEAEANLHQYIETSVVNGMLDISISDGFELAATAPLIVYVTLPSLDAVDAGYETSVYATDKFHGDMLSVKSTGKSFVQLMYQGNSVAVDANNGGRIKLEGSTDNIAIEAATKGYIEAEELTARRALAEVSTNAVIMVHATDLLQATAESRGRIIYFGNPSSVDSNSETQGSVSGN